MLKCPTCGADNLMTAVFCRQCGKKIPIDQLSPDEINASNKEKKKASLASKIASGVILVVFVGLFGALLLPMGGKFASGDDAAQEAAVKKYKTAPRDEQVELTSQEASLLLTKRFKEKDIKGITKIAVDFSAPNNMTIYARSKVFNVPATIVLKGTLEVKEKKLQFTLQKSGMGLITLAYFNSIKDITFVKGRVSEAFSKDNRRFTELKTEKGVVKYTRAAGKSKPEKTVEKAPTQSEK